MSIVAVAGQAGISPVTWGKIENGAPVKAESLVRVAETLGIPGGIVVDACRDPALLPALEGAARGDQRRPRANLSNITDDDLIAEVVHRMSTRREMIARFLAAQGPPAD
jgi:transcriptional regulator with XRE-family HTH domain